MIAQYEKIALGLACCYVMLNLICGFLTYMALSPKHRARWEERLKEKRDADYQREVGKNLDDFSVGFVLVTAITIAGLIAGKARGLI